VVARLLEGQRLLRERGGELHKRHKLPIISMKRFALTFQNSDALGDENESYLISCVGFRDQCHYWLLLCFPPDKVRAAMARICHSQSFLGTVMGRWLDESPNCLLALRLMGIIAWVMAMVSYLVLMNWLEN
jgi:hypothetical protein